jgi:hypothetical protein
MKNLVRFAAVSLCLAATVVPWSAAEAQYGPILTIDPDAQLLESNQILISGTVPCQLNRSAVVTVNVSQKAGQNGAFGAGSVGFFCITDGPQAYSVVAGASLGLFHTGKAHVTASARIDGCDGFIVINEADVHVSK